MQNAQMSDIREIVFESKPTAKLTDSTRLWRYVPLKTLFLYLGKKIFIPSIETLKKKDPFEAVFYYDTINFNQALSNAYGEASMQRILNWIYDVRLDGWKKIGVHQTPDDLINYNSSFFQDAFFEFQKFTHYAWCWFSPAADSESAAMWNLYGNEGAAIITTLGKLRSMLQKTERDYVYSRMHYVHADDGIVANPEELYPGGDPQNTDYVLRPYFLKRAEYESEREVRFVTVASESITGGIAITPEPKDWIEEIRLSPVLLAEEEKCLQKIIRMLYENVPCKRSGLLHDRHAEEGQAIAAQYLDSFLPGTPQELMKSLPPYRENNNADAIRRV